MSGANARPGQTVAREVQIPRISACARDEELLSSGVFACAGPARMIEQRSPISP